ncbi:MAG: GNAT family N-acetyltransferase [Gammaproteobacteria bacterium]
MTEEIKIRSLTQDDALWLKNVIDNDWGGNPLVVRTVSYYPHKMAGLVAFQGAKRIGVLSYEIRKEICEIIVFEVFDKFQGIGTQMLDSLKEIVKKEGCKQIYLMTTNDNLDALRFYQKRGFIISGIHIDSVKKSREIKPTIGLTGDYGIPVRDEIDLTLDL